MLEVTDMGLIVLKSHFSAEVNLDFSCMPMIYQSIDVTRLLYK